MKKFLISLLVIVLALGLLGATAYAGYRYGFAQGVLSASNGDARYLGPWNRMEPAGMRLHVFELNHGFDRNGFGMLQRGAGFGFSPLFGLLAQVLFCGLIIAGLYWLITRSGWRLTRTAPVSTTTVAGPPSPAPAPTEENRES